MLYWTRRIPIIKLVFKERYIGRLRYTFHWQAAIGNALYAGAIITRIHSMEDFLQSLPWSVGRVGLVGIDLGIIGQIHINERVRNKGKELKEDIVSVLTGASTRRNSRRDEREEHPDKWVPLKPMKNRYLQKMSKIAKQLDNQLSDPESSDHSLDSPDEVWRPLITQSNGSPAVYPPRQVTKADSTGSSVPSTPEPTDSESDISDDSSTLDINEVDIMRLLIAEDQRRRQVPSLSWSGAEDFFELNEDEITSILEAEDSYREGIPKVKQNDLYKLTWDPLQSYHTEPTTTRAVLPPVLPTSDPLQVNIMTGSCTEKDEPEE